MNDNEQGDGMNEETEREDVRDWERSDWFRKWMELIRPQPQGNAG